MFRRLKLLINLLYPSPVADPVNIPGGAVPDVVQFHAPTSDRLNASLLAYLIKTSVAELFGDYGIGMISGSLKIIYLSTATSTAIIRISRDHYRIVWAALSFVTNLPKPINTPCVIQVVRNSGTIRKAEEEAIRRAKEYVSRAQRATRTWGNAGIDLLKEHGVVNNGVLEIDKDSEDALSNSDDEG